MAQILAAVNIQQYSLATQIFFSALFFTVLFILINTKKVIPNKYEKKILNYVGAFAAIGVFMTLIMTFIEDQYYIFYSRYKNVFIKLLLVYFFVGSCIIFIILMKYKKYVNN